MDVWSLLAKVINDAASLLGCSVGMADDLTAITLVALGTSLPAPCLCFAFGMSRIHRGLTDECTVKDTLASRTAAMADETADNSIGNITGSCPTCIEIFNSLNNGPSVFVLTKFICHVL